MNSLELNHCLTSFCCYMKKERRREKGKERLKKTDRKRDRDIEREGGKEISVGQWL